MRIRELPEEHELLRRWCEGLDQEYRDQRLTGLARGLSQITEVPQRRSGRRSWPCSRACARCVVAR